MSSKHIYNCQDGCPVESTLQIISGKWKSVILYHLLKNDVMRFNDFTKRISGCSKRMLSLQLKELEDDDVITKKIYPVIPPKTEYRLTDFGQTLSPVIKEMEKWGEMYNSVYSNTQ
ncbi:transcriptional regulator [Apilactobacillus timberlakei]|uniref:winged helix-turn-helix transcriptional regulator n=1 Tax=Apilactobacillus timberlakei TaxID=2008380 RepID=UPI00112A3592|nr:helix-turn-helix domain-containing protein [Apilactobacillus timberlakei]TPR20136.1 transcriptional regulator [Apilactobacillus timberlakei]TPR20449.1 transcriptional regulator [Apilactobacillus timberlakei]TPR21854.1 transcriptional regulator [Apilactobacillus timberlakei]